MFAATTSLSYSPTWVSGQLPLTSPIAHSRPPARGWGSTGIPCGADLDADRLQADPRRPRSTRRRPSPARRSRRTARAQPAPRHSSARPAPHRPERSRHSHSLRQLLTGLPVPVNVHLHALYGRSPQAHRIARETWWRATTALMRFLGAYRRRTSLRHRVPPVTVRHRVGIPRRAACRGR